MKEKTKDLREKLQTIFGKDKIFTNHEGQLLVKCPLCEHSVYKILIDEKQDSLKCKNCKFSANPIALFLDAYSEKPTGALLESDNIEVIKRRTVSIN